MRLTPAEFIRDRERSQVATLCHRLENRDFASGLTEGIILALKRGEISLPEFRERLRALLANIQRLATGPASPFTAGLLRSLERGEISAPVFRACLVDLFGMLEEIATAARPAAGGEVQ